MHGKSQMWKMTKGMQEAVEDHFILEKGQKKSHPIDVAVHVQYYWRSREKAPIGWLFFRGVVVVLFVWLIRLVGWIGGGGCTRTINACAHDFMVNHKSPELGLNLSGS